MNLRELEYVTAIGDHLSFSRAASACNVSQPTLSTQIKKLELELGTPLFHRGINEIRLTALGTRVVESAALILKEARKIQDMATEYRDPSALPLRIGLVPTLAPYLMHYLRGNIAQLLPSLKVYVVEDDAGQLSDLVANRDIDIAIMPRECYAGALDFTHLFDEPLFLVTNCAHRLAKKPSISLYDIPFDQIIRLRKRLGFTSESKVHADDPSDNAIGTNDVDTANIETVCRHVRNSESSALIPALAAEQLRREVSGLVFIPIAEQEERRSIGVVSRIGCPRESLLKAIAAHVRTNIPQGATCLDLPTGRNSECIEKTGRVIPALSHTEASQRVSYLTPSSNKTTPLA